MSALNKSHFSQSLQVPSAPTVDELQHQLNELRQIQYRQAAQLQRLAIEHAQSLQQLELERDQIIQSLMESEERYRAHISATTAVIWHSNSIGEFCVPQQSWHEYTGQAWPHHQRRSWINMIAPEERQRFAAGWQEKLRVGRTFSIECQVWSATDGAYRYCEMSAAPMYDSPQTSIRAWVGSLLDIHDRKLTEEQTLTTNELLQQTVDELQRSNTELEHFVYIASHDLKEPLRGMQNLATMLKDLYAHQLDDEGKELLTMMYESGNRMQQLITDLHNYSRVQLSSDRVQEVEPDQLLDEIIVEFRTLSGQHPFTVNRHGTLPTLYCNPTHLQTIFKNLLSNALKYCDYTQPNIDVGLSESKSAELGSTVFYVKDNGIGIAAENHTVIFEMFKRLHAQFEYGGGTGAGLALVKKTLEQYGGKIWVESAPTSGSTFYFTFGSRPPASVVDH